jgi:hypothetical protein
MPNVRVMHFGLGPIGAAIVKQVATRPGFKIVGVFVPTWSRAQNSSFLALSQMAKAKSPTSFSGQAIPHFL